MSRVMGFQDQGTMAHFVHPGFRKSRCLQEPPGPLDDRQSGSYTVCDCKGGMEALGHLIYLSPSTPIFLFLVPLAQDPLCAPDS